MIMMVSRWRVRDIIPIVWPEIIIYKNRQLTVDIETRRQWSLIISWEQRDHLLAEETNVAIPDEATSSRHSSSTALTSPNILIQPNSYLRAIAEVTPFIVHAFEDMPPRQFSGIVEKSAINCQFCNTVKKQYTHYDRPQFYILIASRYASGSSSHQTFYPIF